MLTLQWEGIKEEEKRADRIVIYHRTGDIPDNLKPVLSQEDTECLLVNYLDISQSNDFLDDADLLIVCLGEEVEGEEYFHLCEIAKRAQRERVPLLILRRGDIPFVPVGENSNTEPAQIYYCDFDASLDEIRGRVSTILEYLPTFRRLNKYIEAIEKWAFSLNARFEELHQELRLAWRVQQDFLPKKLPAAKHIRFGTVYRPASWVSGDIYDVFRLDEEHIGFYLADVVGHGVAAGLMTLFVKRALITKEIGEKSYRILEPGEALEHLNKELVELHLPDHQFITAFYAVINHKTLELRFARAGHPQPIYFCFDGKVKNLFSEGSLLGVFDEVNIETKTLVLRGGEKIIVYSDGLEQAFGEVDGVEKMQSALRGLRNLSATEIAEAINTILDCQERSLHPEDDISAIVMEVI